jgi:signal transduction histidine kinase
MIGRRAVSPPRVRRRSPARRTPVRGSGPNLARVANNERRAAWAWSHNHTVNAVIVALVLAAFEMPAFDPYRHAGGPVWPLWGLVVALPLAWRRRFPVAAVCLSLGGAAGALLTRTGPDWGGLSQIAVLFGPAVAMAHGAATVPSETSQRLVVGAAVAVLATMVVTGSGTPEVMLAQVVVIVAAWLAGETIKARHTEIALLRDRMHDQTERAAIEERTRIARELHDVVAHQLSVIAVQAGAVRVTSGADGPGAPALLVIEQASRQALADLRRALGVLRHDGGGGGVAPQPGLDQLDRLADHLRAAGLPLELIVIGDLTDVPGAIAVSAYRIVQEALTNVLNHAGQAATQVLLVGTPSELRLEIHNAAPTDAPPSCLRTVERGTADRDGVDRVAIGGSSGHGLVGMRERAAAYGGTLLATPLQGGGFQVTASIPLP